MSIFLFCNFFFKKKSFFGFDFDYYIVFFCCSTFCLRFSFLSSTHVAACTNPTNSTLYYEVVSFFPLGGGSGGGDSLPIPVQSRISLTKMSGVRLEGHYVAVPFGLDALKTTEQPLLYTRREGAAPHWYARPPARAHLPPFFFFDAGMR